MKLRIILVAVVAVATLVAGSQLVASSLAQNESEEPAPPRLALCDLVTQAEAEAALGHAVVGKDIGSMCAYAGGSAGVPTALAISLGPEGITPDTFAEGMSHYASAAGAPLRAVPDTGDAAWATAGDPASQIIARQGERFVSVVLINSHEPADERIALLAGLARTALSRMD